MAKRSAKAATPSIRDWSTIHGRITWLVDSLFASNRSAMAQALGLTHTAISRVVTGKKPPGPRLLYSIVERLDVASEWLRDGVGEPFPPERVAGTDDRMPVFDQLPAGRLTGRATRSARTWIDHAALVSPSRYLFRVGPAEPILGEPDLGIRVHDLLLMESDPARFPAVHDLDGHLCAIISRPNTEPPVRLGAVTYYDEGSGIDEGEDRPASLTVDTFETLAPRTDIVHETVFRRYPDGSIRAFEQSLRIVPFRDGTRVVPVREDLQGIEHIIQYTDIVAVWTGIIHRAGRVPPSTTSP
jgi:transcriptional regulator with XRE-family HTH domain